MRGIYARKPKCVIFDLENHLTVDNVKNATIEDVISTNMSLLESLLMLGIPVQQFAKHVRFLTDKSTVFTAAALIRYDQAEILGPQSFMYGDHELYHTYLGLVSLQPKSKAVSGSSLVPSSGKKLRKASGYCWAFNQTRGCKRGEACQYKRECKECAGSHSVADCNSKKK